MSSGIWVVDVGLPSGLARWASSSYGSAGAGGYEGRVMSWAPISRSVSDRRGAMAASETSFTLADTDRVFARETEGALRDAVANSTVVIRHAEPDLAPGSWYTAFSGVVAKWNWPSPLTAQIVARTDDLALRRAVPRSTWLLGAPDWPRILEDAVGKYANIIYGSQDSGGYNKKGMVACPCVDTVLFQYVVSAGLTSIGQVYKDGVATTFGQRTEVRGGKTYTTAVLSASGGTSEITADVYGYDCVTPGGGAMTTNPATMLEHFLTNFCFGDWQTGAWLTPSTRIDATTLAAAEALFTARGYRGGRIVSEASTGYDQIRDWLDTFQFKGWWTSLGKFAFAMEDPTDTGIYIAAPRAVNEAGWTGAFDDQALVTDLVGKYNFQPVEGAYMSTVNASKPKILTEAPDELALTWWAVE